MTSLWLRTAPRIAIDDAPPPASADVVVAGAGLTGLSLAVMLAQAGARVAVLEARFVGAVTTGNTTGKLSLLQGSVYGELRSRNDDEAVAAYGEAQRAGMSWLLGTVGAVDGCAVRAPSVTWATSDSGVQSLEEEFEALAVAGIVPRVTTEDGPVASLPFAPRAALVLDDQAQLQPMRVLGELVRQARALGVQIVEGCRVTGAELDGDAVRVQTTRGEVLADQLALATGTPILDRGLFFAKLEPSRSFVGAYRVAEGAPLPDGMFLSVDEPSFSLRVDPDEQGLPLLLVGGGAHFPGREDHTNELLARLDRWTAEHWPAAVRESWWAAQDYRTTDSVPYAGELPRGGGRIWAATGFNKWGMSNAVASALRLCGAMLGGAPDWSEVLGRGSSGWSAAANVARLGVETAAELAGGWVRAETTRTDEPPGEGEGRVLTEGVHPIAESTVDGVTCRVSGICTHRGGVLGWNEAERSWDCPLHGSRFAPDGTLLEGPAVSDLDPYDDRPEHDRTEKEDAR